MPPLRLLPLLKAVLATSNGAGTSPARALIIALVPNKVPVPGPSPRPNAPAIHLEAVVSDPHHIHGDSLEKRWRPINPDNMMLGKRGYESPMTTTTSDIRAEAVAEILAESALTQGSWYVWDTE